VASWRDDGNKPYKVSFNDSIPIVSQEEYDADDKNTSHKNSGSAADREKEDKAILSSLPKAVSKELDGYERHIGEAEPLPNSYVRFMERSGEELDGNLLQ
jgi:bromodomain and PHD finger-containing protein 1